MTRKEESSDTELEKSNQLFYVQLVGQRRHKRKAETGAKITIIMKRKTKIPKDKTNSNTG